MANTSAELADGDHTFAVSATNTAGNTDRTPASRSFRVCTGPLSALAIAHDAVLRAIDPGLAEQQYQELKDELGLDHFEGRSLPGWQRHVVLTALTYAWLQHERRRHGARLPTLPIARAVFTEILTAHFFVTRPHYLKTMQKLAEINLRI